MVLLHCEGAGVGEVQYIRVIGEGDRVGRGKFLALVLAGYSVYLEGFQVDDPDTQFLIHKCQSVPGIVKGSTQHPAFGLTYLQMQRIVGGADLVNSRWANTGNSVDVSVAIDCHILDDFVGQPDVLSIAQAIQVYAGNVSELVVEFEGRQHGRLHAVGGGRQEQKSEGAEEGEQEKLAAPIRHKIQ